MHHQQRQRGGVSVEFMLLLPVVMMLILGAAHFGSVINTRHRLTDGANYAVRAAAVRRTPDAASVRAMIETRMGSSTADCSTINVVTNLIDDGGLTRLEVVATCNLVPPFSSTLLGAIGPSSVTVDVAMPY